MIRENGFTLVELLAALAVGGLLLAGLAAYTGTLARQVARQMPSTAARILDFSPMLETMIGNAVPPKRSDQPVRAETGALRLLVPAPMALGRNKPVLMTLNSVATTGGVALDLSLAERDGRSLGIQPATFRLIDGLEGIAFDYVQPGARQPFPKLVRIILRSFKGERWTIVAEPRHNRPADCVFDPISLACR